mmetsp:Transcript_111171/g.313717  ORF Transcript_111171/g.313717 Transcript_111171/m.313717 type:complete len:287 (+) Transcript_111171:91-951(+)
MAPFGDLVPGVRVKVHGLQSETGRALNGSVGCVKCLDTSSGRLQVDIEGQGLRAIKQENLEPVLASSSSAPAEVSQALATLEQALGSDAGDDRRFHALRSVKDAGLAASCLETSVVACLEDTNWKIRGAAVEALASIGCAKFHGKLLEGLLVDTHGDVRFAAAGALGQMACAHTEALAAALKDEDEGVRMAAAVALGKAGVPAARPYAGALATLLDEDSVQLRLAGANSLARLGDAVVPYLRRLVEICEEDSSKEVCLAAALAVAQAGEAADCYETRVEKVLQKLS